MEINIFGIISSIYKSFVTSGFFYYLKIVAGFLVVILLVADILLLSKRLQGDVKVAIFGSKAPRFKKSLYTKRWEAIRKGVNEGNISAGKIAVIEADKMLGEVLEKIGYKGKDTGEKIAAVKVGQLEGIQDAVRAHETFRQIVQDPSHKIGLEGLQETLAGYEKVFRGLELLD